MLDIKYVAGLFDGEGWVRISTWQKPSSIHVRYSVHGGINMCHRPIIESLHAQFGGHFYVQPRPNPKHRTLYAWVFASKQGRGVLRLMRPHLVVKAAEVDLALELQDSIDTWKFKLGSRYFKHPERDAIFAYRKRLASEMSELKHIRFDPA